MYDNLTSFDDLIDEGIRYLKKSGRTGSSLDKYRWTWRQIESFMGGSPYESLSAGVSEFIKQKYGSKNPGDLSHHHKTCIRQALCLVQFAETGEMPAQIEFVRREQVVLNGEVGARMAEFIAYKRSMRLHEKTLRGYRYYLYLLNKYLNENGIDGISHISPLVLLHYVSILLPGTPGAKHLALSITRSFFRYLFNQGLTATDLSVAIPRDNYKKQSRLPSVYSKEEVKAILGTADRSTCTGKRNYAILLLAVRLGLRASDIRNLQFENISWPGSRISFVQQKTKVPIALPLPTDVGEALVDYLKYGRPASDLDYVFVEHIHPYVGLGEKAVPRIARKAIQRSDIEIGNRKHGSHALRHTLANFLLGQKTSLPVISQILGHENVQTSMNYLRIDIGQLRQCALEVPMVPEGFYEQKNGALYE
jgi:site-specific recombinase XerD